MSRRDHVLPPPRPGRRLGEPLWLVVAVAALLTMVGGCGSDDKGKTDAGADTSFPLFDSGGGANDAGADTADTAETKVGCPGAADCSCADNSDCDSALCIRYADGKRCAKLCTDGGCAADETCVELQSGGDSLTACAPRYAALCDPCRADKDCVGAGAAGAACVDRGAEGAFCGTTCSESGDCPAGYECADRKSIGGTDVKQCVPSAGAACGCSPTAIALELSTDCAIVGEGGAQCPGKRACLADGKSNAPSGGGLSTCLGAAPGPEVCDGSDNDCDGTTDEGIDGCDDGNPCTVDTCDASLGCVHNPSTTACDDNNACTENDACKDIGGTVQCAGTAVSCDDGNGCTTDACDMSAGCTHTVAASSGCDDGDPCTQADACADVGGAAGCVGTVVDCDDQDECTIDSCDPTSGACKSVVAQGASCDDGDVCTAGDVCVALDGGAVGCAGGLTKTCDDGNACTTDACDSVTGCTYTAQVGQAFTCYGGAANTQDVGTCVAGVALCQADGSLGSCTGEVVPKPLDGCDEKDDDCDGTTDEDCAAGPVQVRWRMASASIGGSAGGKSVRAVASGAPFGGLFSGGTTSVGVGFLQALRAFGL